MFALRVVLGLLIAGQVAVAILLWPELPARIPTHFGGDGSPDNWAAPDIEWFVISGVLALIGGGLGFVMPGVVDRLVGSDSALLSVPDRERFSALPLPARLAAMWPVRVGVVVIGCELQVLTMFLLGGTYLVARGDWSGLPQVGLYGLMALLLVTSTVIAVGSSRAVRREIAAAGVG
ncbi:MAG: DUF1648 domain-containing protein [Planctomycetes bacterium]|nr:DUF1648 domain-containing protein [Planctomycetota bacterium]